MVEHNDGGTMADINGGINLDSGAMVVSDSSIIYGNANAGATVATLRVNEYLGLGRLYYPEQAVKLVLVSCSREHWQLLTTSSSRTLLSVCTQ